MPVIVIDARANFEVKKSTVNINNLTLYSFLLLLLKLTNGLT